DFRSLFVALDEFEAVSDFAEHGNMMHGRTLLNRAADNPEAARMQTAPHAFHTALEGGRVEIDAVQDVHGADDVAGRGGRFEDGMLLDPKRRAFAGKGGGA